MKNTNDGNHEPDMGCSGCECLMLGRWEPWCGKVRTLFCS